MTPPLEPCEKHEVTNCAYCTGTAREFQDSLDDPAPDPGALPKIPGGPTIYAQFPGTCARCGRRYERHSPIHHSREDDGWIGVECCAS